MDADSLDALSAVSSPAASDPFCAHLQQAPREIRKLLSEYPDVLSSHGFSASTPKHGVFHNLPTAPGPPVFAKARRLDPEKLASAKAEFLKMEKAGIVRRSSSPWSSPLHYNLNLMVPGDPVAIFVSSTLPLLRTGIPCPPLLISPPG